MFWSDCPSVSILVSKMLRQHVKLSSIVSRLEGCLLQKVHVLFASKPALHTWYALCTLRCLQKLYTASLIPIYFSLQSKDTNLYLSTLYCSQYRCINTSLQNIMFKSGICKVEYSVHPDFVLNLGKMSF